MFQNAAVTNKTHMRAKYMYIKRTVVRLRRDGTVNFKPNQTYCFQKLEQNKVLVCTCVILPRLFCTCILFSNST